MARRKMTQDKADEYDCPTPLFEAIHSNEKIEDISLILQTKDIYQSNKSGNTAFHYAILNKNCEALQVMLDSVTDRECFTKKNDDGCNILLLAAMKNVPEAIEIICDHPYFEHPDINKAHSQTGYTALHWASIHGDIHLYETLRRYGASFEEKNTLGETVVLKAAQCNNSLLLDHMLSEFPLTVNEPDRKGNSPLLVAVQENCLQSFQILLKYEANPTTKNSSGFNALSLSIQLSRRDMAKALINCIGREELQQHMPNPLLKQAEDLLGENFTPRKSSFLHILCCAPEHFSEQCEADKVASLYETAANQENL